MPDDKAQQIKTLWERELTKQTNARNLWQDTADHIYPYAQITSFYTAGEPRTTFIYDMTPMLDMLDMVSGLKHVLIPTGQPFFSIKASDSRFAKRDSQRYMAYATEIAHEKILQSNFVTEFDEVLRSLIVFGPGDIFSQWTKKEGLSYRASEIGTYILIEDSYKNVIGSIHKLSLTAESAYKQFGDKAGDKVKESALDERKKYDIFEFLHNVTLRQGRNPKLSDDYNLNMPYESCYVNLKEVKLVEEGGYLENPYHTARWMRPTHEKDGRGIATEILPQIKVLYQQMKDFIECGNKWNNSPYLTNDNYIEGEVNLSPGGRTHVTEDGAVQAIPPGVIGNFPITEKSLEYVTNIIHRAFFKNAFSPLEDLTGSNRMTELEVRERIRSVLPKIGPPVGRVWVELLDKLLTRSILLLIRNGEIERPPVELAGQNFGIEYVGPFALALRSSQAKGFQEWVTFVGAMSSVFPDAPDNVDSDDAIIRMGQTFGVNVEDMATVDERDAKRKKRAQDEQQIKMAQAMQVASEAYGKTTKSPEQGSPAKQLMGEGT